MLNTYSNERTKEQLPHIQEAQLLIEKDTT